MANCINGRDHMVHGQTGHCTRCGMTAGQINPPPDRPVPLPIDEPPAAEPESAPEK